MGKPEPGHVRRRAATASGPGRALAVGDRLDSTSGERARAGIDEALVLTGAHAASSRPTRPLRRRRSSPIHSPALVLGSSL